MGAYVGLGITLLLVLGISYLLGYVIARFLWPRHKQEFKHEHSITNLFVGLLTFVLLSIGLAIMHPVLLTLGVYILGIATSFPPIRKLTKSSLNQHWRKVFHVATFIMLATGLVLLTVEIYFRIGIRIDHKAKQSEAKTNISSIATAQISFYAEKNRWGKSFDEIGWSPQGLTRYSYYMSGKEDRNYFPRTNTSEPRPRKQISYNKEKRELTFGFNATQNAIDEKTVLERLALPRGIGANANDFTAVAIGNIDSDPYLDVWIINKNKIAENIQNDNTDSPGDERPIFSFFGVKKYSNRIVVSPDEMYYWLLAFNLIVCLLFEIPGLIKKDQEVAG